MMRGYRWSITYYFFFDVKSRVSGCIVSIPQKIDFSHEIRWSTIDFWKLYIRKYRKMIAFQLQQDDPRTPLLLLAYIPGDKILDSDWPTAVQYLSIVCFRDSIVCLPVIAASNICLFPSGFQAYQTHTNSISFWRQTVIALPSDWSSC